MSDWDDWIYLTKSQYKRVRDRVYNIDTVYEWCIEELLRDGRTKEEIDTDRDAFFDWLDDNMIEVEVDGEPHIMFANKSDMAFIEQFKDIDEPDFDAQLKDGDK